MDKQTEKKRNIHRITHDQRCQVVTIPLDLTLEILSRLPAKSFVRFLCVSKLWSSFTKLPSFINSFTTHSSARPRSLVVICSGSSPAEQKRFVFFFPQKENPDGSYPTVYRYQMTNSNDYHYAKSKCVQGLVLLQGFVIWNPAMRRFLKDEHGHEWTRKHFVLPSKRGKTQGRADLSFHGVTAAGELIFTRYSFYESFYILYFDPRRNSIREALFKGHAGHEFRCRYGLGNKSGYETI